MGSILWSILTSLLPFIIIVQSNNLSHTLIIRDIFGRHCSLKPDYWKIIRWYFGEMTYIEFTEIVQKREISSQFPNRVITQLLHGIWQQIF